MIKQYDKDGHLTQEYCVHMFETTRDHFYLSGWAGTGKTKTIKDFLSTTKKKVVVCAPTGIAAVNAGGQTIHSLFSLPPRTVDKRSLTDLSNYPRKKALFDSIDTIIIDEVSMVRADLMDTIYWFFEKNYPDLVWGGKQIIMVGDLDQLPPVIVSQAEQEMINKRYGGNEFFHGAQCWKGQTDRNTFTTLNLTKVYRQADPQFIDLLNKIKRAEVTQEELDTINERCFKEKLTPEDGVALCASNDLAARINAKKLSQIEGEVIQLEGITTGEFNMKNCPVEPVVYLKPDCRVMIMANDMKKRYHNGTIGTFIRMDEDFETEEEVVVVKLESGTIVKVPRSEFHSIKYDYDRSLDEIKPTVSGSFSQFPIKVCYAMTIHKSQGQTFDKIVIDLGRGAFAHGQLYVALSRCKTLEGISLRVPIKLSDVVYNKMSQIV